MWARIPGLFSLDCEGSKFPCYECFVFNCCSAVAIQICFHNSYSLCLMKVCNMYNKSVLQCHRYCELFVYSDSYSYMKLRWLSLKGSWCILWVSAVVWSSSIKNLYEHTTLSYYIIFWFRITKHNSSARRKIIG